MKDRICIPCEGNMAPLSLELIKERISSIANWQLSDCGKYIYKIYEFKGYYKVISFANAIAWVANREQHHPDLELNYNRCTVKLTTHAINGLSDNDFIIAEMIDLL